MSWTRMVPPGQPGVDLPLGGKERLAGQLIELVEQLEDVVLTLLVERKLQRVEVVEPLASAA